MTPDDRSPPDPSRERALIRDASGIALSKIQALAREQQAMALDLAMLARVRAARTPASHPPGDDEPG
jgi:hypothetical protein